MRSGRAPHRRAALLDRDGTLMIDHGYVGRAEDVQLLPDVGWALRQFAAAGLVLIVVTNQSGVARGLFGRTSVDVVNQRLAELLAREHVDIARFYVCPHGPLDGCGCRKPLNGLALAAAADFDLDLKRSLCVGDRERDVAMGKSVGAFTALIGSASHDATSSADVAGSDWRSVMPAIHRWLTRT